MGVTVRKLLRNQKKNYNNFQTQTAMRLKDARERKLFFFYKYAITKRKKNKDIGAV